MVGLMNLGTSVDIFCRVVDNYGDIGVCWRLARALADEGGCVRLYVDDLVSFSHIVPVSDPRIQVREWGEGLAYDEAADIVIEAFACDLPECVIGAMRARDAAPLWVDLEYLTAEDWAVSCHVLPSTHPSTSLRKYMFFPGFDERTGGLIREKGLIERRNRFQSCISEQNDWRTAHNLPEFNSNFIDLSLFCYRNADIERLFSEFSTYSSPVRVFFPVRDGFGVETTGALTVYRIPFVPQDQYDYLLWTMQGNFVRGEDSFVRAQFAGRPVVWQIYPQDEEAHLVKLRAFLSLYGAAFSPNLREGLAESFDLWNVGGANGKIIWQNWLDRLPDLQVGARKWADYLSSQTDLVQRLMMMYKQNNILIKKDKL